MLPRKLNGIATATAIACAGRSPSDAAGDQRLEDGEVDQQRGDADREEADRLEAGVAVAGAEGPVAVPEEVVGDGDAEGADRGDRVVDAELPVSSAKTARLIR